jgi:hypothetical protein
MSEMENCALPLFSAASLGKVLSTNRWKPLSVGAGKFYAESQSSSTPWLSELPPIEQFGST